jgi:CrcB protein
LITHALVYYPHFAGFGRRIALGEKGLAVFWKLLVVGIGAAVGANARYLLTIWATERFGTTLPYGTLLANLIGCIAIGIVLALAASHLPLSEPWRLLIVTGLLGGFTTFSSFSYETYALVRLGRLVSAGLYAGGSVLLGLIGVVLGAAIVEYWPS